MSEQTPQDLQQELAKLRRRCDRERSARLAAEGIAEQGLRDLYEKQQQLELLEAVAIAANQAASIKDALQFAVKRICQFTGWTLGHAFITQAIGGERQLVSTSIWFGAEDAATRAFCRDTEAMRFALGVGLPGRGLATGAPCWIIDVAQDPGFLRATSAHRAGLRAAFAFPILAGSRVHAVLEFFSKLVLAPDEKLLALVSQIGTQLGRVAEREEADAKLIHDASHDPLTGLPNRALFVDRLARAVSRHRRHAEANFAILYIDFDRFKVVNDSLGHLAGDALIIEVAARFLTSLRQSDMVARPSVRPAAPLTDDYDTLARLGGDEFTVLLDDIQETSDAVRIASRILAALAQPIVLQGQEIYVSASIGIATSATPYLTADEVLRDADLAMYRAKALGKGRFEIFDQAMHDAAKSRLKLETNLRRALQNDEFLLHYQPIVDLRTGEISGFEALVRWLKDGTRVVYPGDFIDVAEDTGLILPLGLWVLEEACGTMQRWHRSFPRTKPLTISVNISGRQFAQPDVVELVQQTIGRTGIDPQAVRLELTESVTMGDAERAVRILDQLRNLGVRISVDDFGTGYSSLSYLQRLPLDVLKIDRSFVAQLDHGSDGLQIVRTIMDLARNLGMDVVAEGIETGAHVQHLTSLGCDSGQGHFFAKPMAATRAQALLSSGTAWPQALPKSAS